MCDHEESLASAAPRNLRRSAERMPSKEAAGDLSLYRNASSCAVSMRKVLFKPGCPTSWQTALTSSA